MLLNRKTQLISKRKYGMDFSFSRVFYRSDIPVLPLVILGLFLLTTGFAQGQHQVQGTVSDALSGEPLPGATVRIKETVSGTITDADGRYSIDLADPQGVIVVSFMGYLEEEIPVSGRNMINVSLHPSVQMLSEMVVIGYGVQRKSDLTGAVSMIGSDEVRQSPVIGVLEAMQGRASGVQITQSSGAPGASPQIRIRGTGTIGNADPLYVVDGMTVSDIGFLNPNDIESISILKDASAAAIYGARAANGVVLIVTRRGEESDRARISFNSYAGVQNITTPYQVLSGRQHAELNIESFANMGAPHASPFHARLFDPETQEYDFSRLDTETDWFSEISRLNAPVQNHHLSITGGSAASRYLVSFGIFDQQGTINHTSARKYTFRLNNDLRLNSRLTLGSNLALGSSLHKGMRENDRFAPITEAFLMDPNTPVYDTLDAYIWRSGPTIVKNPVASQIVENSVGETTYNDLRGSVFAEYEILESLKFRSQYGLTYWQSSNHIFLPTYEMRRADQRRETAELYLNDRGMYNWSVENTLTWSQQLGDHSLTALAGFSAYYDRFEWTNLGRTRFPSNATNFQHLSSALDPGASAEGSFIESTMASFLGRVIYSYQGRYNATVSMRRDGSSKFGRENRYGNFPSFSLGWRISEEQFMQNLTVVNMLTLRGGWGIIGNNQIPVNQFTTLINVEPYLRYPFGNQIFPGAAPNNAGNPEVKWEESIQMNMGLDLGLWDDRLQMNFDVFEKNTSGLLVQVPVPMLVGLMENPTVNAGNIRNRGWELSLSYRNFDNRFKYEINGNVSHIQNMVTELGRGVESIISGENVTEVGQPISSFYGWVADGIFQNEDEVSAHAFQHNRTAPGDIRFKDLNGDGIIDAKDRTFLGSPFPDYVFGLGTNLSYGLFEFNVFLQGMYGNQVYNQLARITSVPGRDNMNIGMLDRWTGEGTSNTVPWLTAADYNNNARMSSRFIEDGSFLRIKNVQLTFSVPERFVRRANMYSLKVYVAAHNLYTFTNYTGMDPEIARDNRFYGTNELVLGVDRGNYPAAQTFITGIEVSF